MADVKQRTSLEKVLSAEGAKIGQLWRKAGPAGRGREEERERNMGREAGRTGGRALM